MGSQMGYSSTYFIFVSLCVLGCVLALPNEPKPCSTPACKHAADYIIDSMNSTANPCDNFYEYACGGWKHKTIPDSKLTIATSVTLNDQMVAGMQGLLDKFNIQRERLTSASSVQYGAYVYQQCLALGKQTNEVGLAELKEVVKSILVDQNWEIGQKSAQTKAQPWTENFVKAASAGVISVFAFAFTLPDPKNVSVNMLTVTSSEIGPAFQNNKTLTAYKDYIRKSAKLFCGGKCDVTLLENDIDEIVKLELELAMNELPAEKQLKPEYLLNVMTFKDLKDKTKLDWLNQVIKPIKKSLGISKHELSESSRLVVTDVNYMVKAVEILSKTSQRTLANYVGWRIVSQFGRYSSEQFRQIEFEYNKARLGVKTLEERKEKCYMLTNQHTKLALSRLFVDHFFSESEKKEVADLVENIQDSYRDLLNQNTWLDTETKKASLNKLNHVTKNVAYPEWLRHNDQLDEYYLLHNKTEAQNLLTNKNYLTSLVKFSSLQLKKGFVELGKAVQLDKRWPFPPAEVVAAYFGLQNSITMAAGILKFPCFDGQRPFSLNYGASGTTIAHEFTHGLDDSGRQYDEMGNLRNWWTAEAVERFHNRSECFIEQYSSLVDKASGLHVNGKLSLGENIADNGGVRVAYNAFQAKQAKSGRSPTLADLPKLTSEQLYFISFANNYCALYRPEIAKLLMLIDPHTPPELLVNTALKNSHEFSDAFKCPATSPMNPDKKCAMW